MELLSTRGTKPRVRPSRRLFCDDRVRKVADLMKTAPERFYGIMNMWPGQVYLVSGGLPVTVNNRLVGSVGVSGLPSGVDEKAAQSGIAAWEKFREGQKK